jgi:hypothetical protein
MDQPIKGNRRKVNHKKYLQRRLQRQGSPKTMRQQMKRRPSPPACPRPSADLTATLPPFVHCNSWPTCIPSQPQQEAPSTQPNETDQLDYLLQQLSPDLPTQPTTSRLCSESTIYTLMSTTHQPISTLESQVLIGEQPYGSPYTPSNSSVDELFDDSAYSSPCSSVYNSPATTMATTTTCSNDWGLPAATCVATTNGLYNWGMTGPLQGMTTTSDPAHLTCMTLCNDWVSSLPAMSTTYTTTCDQTLPVPQLWDSDHIPY